MNLFSGIASSPLSKGIDLSFAVPTTRNMIEAKVGPDSSSVTYFSVDGSGNLYTKGNLSVGGSISKGGGTFKIDHPLDPADKYLYHSFVESPDMMNIYNGVVQLNARGEAWIKMPDWFEALNMDFRYQLTAMGRPAPNLYIAREIKGNRFKVSGGRAHGKVSWQVTGIRRDAYANAHRVRVEEEKPPAERGKYLYPEGFGHSEQDSVTAATPAATDTGFAAGAHR